MTIRMSVAAMATVVGLGALTACGGDDEPDSNRTDSSSETTDETTDETGDQTDGTEETDVVPEETEDAPAEPAEPPAAAGAPVPVGETITDDVLGHTITVVQVLRDFPPPAEFSGIAEDGGELVLVEVDVTAGDEFSGGVQGGFELVAGGDTVGTKTGIADDEITAAGYAPFEGVGSGEKGGGWLCFQVNTRSDAYELQYTRAEADIIGSDQTIEERVWTVALP